MIKTVQTIDGIDEPKFRYNAKIEGYTNSSSDINELNKIFRLPWSIQASENHKILPPSFNQKTRGKNNMCQIATQPCITTVKRLTVVQPNFFLTWGARRNGINNESLLRGNPISA